MLKLQDFVHLPQLDDLLGQLLADEPSLVVVAGLDPRQVAGDAFLPSGRAAIWGILWREFLAAHPRSRAIIVAGDRAAARISRRISRPLRRRVQVSLVGPAATYAQQIADTARRRPDLLVIDRLCPESLPGALYAAHDGVRVLSQLDTVFRGAAVLRQIGGHEPLPRAWVVAVQRLPALCSNCKEPVSPDPAQIEALRRSPHLAPLLPDQPAAFYRAHGCSQCRWTGREGDIAVFDVLRADPPAHLSQEEYMLHLALQGHLPLNDLLHLDADQLGRTYSLLSASEHALTEANTALQRKLVELETANQVLQQRTQALISLQDISQALIGSMDLPFLADRVCRRACSISDADHAILYVLQDEDTAQVLAVHGWDPALVGRELNAAPIRQEAADEALVSFNDWPPGVPYQHPDVAGIALQAGLRIPLVAQDKPVGLMIVHSTRRPHFARGDEALLYALANQVALAIQRARLVQEQIEKERLERELDLARQVQQSVLPRIFPQVPGYAFAAHNEPARQVGGDFYDIIDLEQNLLGLVIGDVSDKGMPAALYMALTRSLLLAESRRASSPAAVLRSVNHLLMALGEPDMFVTVFYGIVDRATGQLTYARAGHDRPLLLRDGTIQRLAGEGTILGLLDEADLYLSEEHVQLRPGDRLVLYTDGLTDVENEAGQLFDLRQLEALVLAQCDPSPAGLCDAVMAGLRTFQGRAEQYDDMTMLVMAID